MSPYREPRYTEGDARAHLEPTLRALRELVDRWNALRAKLCEQATEIDWPELSDEYRVTLITLDRLEQLKTRAALEAIAEHEATNPAVVHAASLTLEDLLTDPGTVLLKLEGEATREDHIQLSAMARSGPVKPVLLVVHEGEGDVTAMYLGVQPWRMADYPMKVPLSMFTPEAWGGNFEAFARAMRGEDTDVMHPGVCFCLQVTVPNATRVRATLICRRA